MNKFTRLLRRRNRRKVAKVLTLERFFRQKVINGKLAYLKYSPVCPMGVCTKTKFEIACGKFVLHLADTVSFISPVIVGLSGLVIRDL